MKAEDSVKRKIFISYSGDMYNTAVLACTHNT